MRPDKSGSLDQSILSWHLIFGLALSVPTVVGRMLVGQFHEFRCLYSISDWVAHLRRGYPFGGLAELVNVRHRYHIYDRKIQYQHLKCGHRLGYSSSQTSHLIYFS